MPGFITTKTGELETIDDLKRQIEDACNYVDTDQLGRAPQCGFALAEEGKTIKAEDQWQKLELEVKAAEAIWARSDPCYGFVD